MSNLLNTKNSIFVKSKAQNSSATVSPTKGATQSPDTNLRKVIAKNSNCILLFYY